jgi:hypothetical protein
MSKVHNTESAHFGHAKTYNQAKWYEGSAARAGNLRPKRMLNDQLPFVTGSIYLNTLSYYRLFVPAAMHECRLEPIWS